MATLPKATTNVVDTAGAVASGTDTICILSPVATNADTTPRLYGNANDIYAQHGYSEGVEYAALHAQQTRKPILFVGLPIATPGAITREDTSGKTGTCVTTLAAGGSGVLGEHDGVLTVITGGTVGTDQIVIGLSLDGGVTTKRVRLGTATSYALPFVGVTASFSGGGTLVAGDTIHTWHGTAPVSNADGWLAAFAALGAGTKSFRSVLLCGDLTTDTLAASYLAQLDGYRTTYERFVFGRASVADRLPLAAMARTQVRMTGSPTLTFAEVGATGDTITRSSGSFIADGFAAGDTITVAGSAGNNVTGVVATVAALVLTLDTTDLVAEGPVAGCSVVGTPTLTFAEVGSTGDTIVRSRGSWLADGFRNGDAITITGTASNNISAATVATVTATTLTLGSTDLVAEVIGSYGVAVSAGQTKAVWMAAQDAEFASIDAAPRIDLSAGRGRVLSPFSGWNFRRPAAWAASLREYQHDLHVATWRKSDGPTGFGLYDTDGTLVEWDDRIDGGAGEAARFTCFRSWANGPQGAFIAQSLTRATDGSLLGLTHNESVVNLACTITQIATENFIGRSLVLNDDGTATSDSLSLLEGEVNAALELALLANRGEGPRASKAVWSASKDDVLNVAEPLLTGVLELNLNGTIHSVTTSVRVISGGQ
jgi:hypothetical protein